MSDVFISYVGKSRKQAELLAFDLHRLGITRWLADRNVSGEEAFEKQMLAKIKAARLIVFVVAPHSSASHWVQKEYMAALESSWSDKNKILIPILIRDAEPPSFLRHIHGIKVEGRRTDWTRAAKEVAKILSEGMVVKDNKAAMKEQTQRLNLIEKQASLLWSDGQRAGKLKSVT
jgi:hypothetical protein